MAKLKHSQSGPQETDQPKEATSTDIGWYDLASWEETELYDEIIVQFLPSGELQRFLRWRNPKTNTQRRETLATEKILDKLIPPGTADKMMGRERSKERAHRNRKTRALGNKLRIRGEARRKGS